MTEEKLGKRLITLIQASDELGKCGTSHLIPQSP